MGDKCYRSCHVFRVMRGYIDCGQYHWQRSTCCRGDSSAIYDAGNLFSSIVNSGTVVQYSYHIGACNLKKAQEIFSQGAIIAVLAGIAILAGMLAGKDFFLATISADTEVIDYANDYYSLIVFYLCLDPLSCLLDNTMVVEGGEKVSSIANIIEIVSNLIFSIIFGLLWGVTGIAAASIVCKLLFLLINFAWFFIKKNNIAFVWRLDFKECVNILSQGIVKASTFSLSALMAFMLNYYVLAICLSLVIVYMAYGKEAVPFLIQPEKNMHSYCYDFEITTENVISIFYGIA